MSEDTIDITIGGRPFTLRGLVGEHVEVEWRMPAVNLDPNDPLASAVDIGPISDETAQQIADKLAVDADEDFVQKLQGAIRGLEQVWGLASDALDGARFKVTELSVNTRTSVYTFGFGVALPNTTSSLSAFGVTLDSFGLMFTYQKTAP